MTKPRPSASVEQALSRIAGQLPAGVDEMATATGRSASLVRKWGDPERREKISIDDAIVLDLRFQAAGGLGAPLHEAYTTQLGIAGATRFADQFALGHLLPEVIKETSEAEMHIALAALPGANLRQRQRTADECRQAIAKLTCALHLLESDERDVHPSTGPPATAS